MATITVNDVTYNITLDVNGSIIGDLNELSDVTISSPTNGQVLQYNGSVWINNTASGSGDMLKSIYDTNDDGIVDNAASLSGSTLAQILAAGGSPDNITLADTHVEILDESGFGRINFSVDGVDQLNIVDGAIRPETNSDISLGITTRRWSNLYTDAITVTNNITVGGTVDGRDIATDGTKLDGIEAGADVTDTANVTAAGALMDSEVTNLAQVKAFNSADYASASHTHSHTDITDYDVILAGTTNTTVFTPTGDYHPATKKYVDDEILAAGGYTDEAAQDAIGTILTDSSEIDFTYNDATPSITATIIAGSIDETKLDTSVNASLDLADSALQAGDNISSLTNDSNFIATGDNITVLNGTADRLLYVNSTGDVSEIALGSSGTYLQSQGLTSVPTWSIPAGSGDVSKVGTPVDNQIGVWTGNGTIEGDADFTWDATTLTIGGKQSITYSGADNNLLITPTGDAGNSTSVGGALRINNTSNIGSALIVYSNAGATADGRLVNIRADNALFPQTAFHIDYDGTANAAEIVNNSTDSSSQALNVVSNNPNDTTMGINGVETGKGTLKIVHTGTGSDSNASAISIDLQGTGTASQGIYVDSSSGTTGNLLRIRNSGVDKFVVSSSGSVTLSGTVDGRDIAADGAKLDGIETGADVTDETNVLSSLSGATITSATVATGDKVLIQDVSDSDNIKTVTTQSIADLVDTSSFITGDSVTKITVGTTTPSSPSTGDLWIDTN